MAVEVPVGDEPLVSYTLFRDRFAQSREEREDVPWSELCSRIRNAPTYVDKKHCPLISLAAYGETRTDNNCLRHADNVLRVYGVEIDYDGEQVPPEDGARRLQDAGLRSIIYTSPSHTDAAPRWRALLPLSEPAEPDKRIQYVARANRALGGIATKESFTLSQSFYLGRVRGAAYHVIETTGRDVDMAADLEPQYYTGHDPDGQSPRDLRTDDDLRESFAKGEDRYQAMLKLSARWAARGMAYDDIVAALTDLLDKSGNGMNADGIDLHSRVEPLARSAVQKFGRKDAPPIVPPIPPRPPDPDKAATRRPMRWRELELQPTPQRVWRIEHWLGTGPSLLAGAGGVGKSLFGQCMGTALSDGRFYLDKVVEPQTVLMWACEDDHDEIWRRQVAICQYFRMPLSALEGKFIVEPRLGMDNALFGLAYGQPVWTPLRGELTAQILDYRATVVLLDNIGQLFGGNENDRHHVTTFVNGLSSVTPWPLSTILFGHPAKASGSEFSGSTAWENAMRMRWFLGTSLPDQPESTAVEDGVRYLAKRKTNYSVKDYRRLTYMDGVMVPDSPPSHGAMHMHHERQEGARKRVLNALRTIGETGIQCTASSASPDYLPKRMLAMKLADDFTQREIAEALNALLVAGVLKVEKVGQYSNRTPKMGLVEVKK